MANLKMEEAVYKLSFCDPSKLYKTLLALLKYNSLNDTLTIRFCSGAVEFYVHEASDTQTCTNLRIRKIDLIFQTFICEKCFDMCIILRLKEVVDFLSSIARNEAVLIIKGLEDQWQSSVNFEIMSAYPTETTLTLVKSEFIRDIPMFSMPTLSHLHTGSLKELTMNLNKIKAVKLKDASIEVYRCGLAVSLQDGECNIISGRKIGKVGSFNIGKQFVSLIKGLPLHKDGTYQICSADSRQEFILALRIGDFSLLFLSVPYNHRE